MILVARLRYVPSLLYVVLLGVIYTSVLPTTNTANVWSSIALLLFNLEVDHRSQTTEYACRGTHPVSYTHLTLPTICSV